MEGHTKACCLGAFLDEPDITVEDQFLQRIIDAGREFDELLALLTPWGLKRAWVVFEISCFIPSGKRVVTVHHGLTPAKLMANPQVGDLLNRHPAGINKLDSYFAALRRRSRRHNEVPMGDTPQVFLSYAQADQGLAQAVADRLHDQGIRVWTDHQLAPGQRWIRAWTVRCATARRLSCC